MFLESVGLTNIILAAILMVNVAIFFRIGRK